MNVRRRGRFLFLWNISSYRGVNDSLCSPKNVTFIMQALASRVSDRQLGFGDLTIDDPDFGGIVYFEMVVPIDRASLATDQMRRVADP
jgi:hypothetical protein